MENLIDIQKLTEFLQGIGDQLLTLLGNPLFWLQFAVIAVVFALSKWLFAPLAQKGLSRLTLQARKLPFLLKPLGALGSLANPLTWLILQWIAIDVVNRLQWPNRLLIVVASLLTAWLLIQVATLLVANRSLAKFIAVSAWTVAALKIFDLLDEVTALLNSWSVKIGEASITPLTLVKAGISLWLFLWIANGIAALIERKLKTSQSVSPAMRVLGAKLARILLIAFAFLIALDAVGIDLTALAVFSGALGVGLGFGLQKIFSNLVSGVILLMDRSIKPGDVIAVNNTYGWINHLGARYASVVTRDGVEHLIPNEIIITTPVENWSYSNSLVRLKIAIGISYRSDPRKAIALCLEAASQVPRILKDPEPKCQVSGFGESSVDLSLRVWINDPQLGRGSVVSDVLLEVWDRFNEHGIEIPFPQRDLHIKSMPADRDLLTATLAEKAS
jgi:small-conductance mechanosensitive channel